MHELMHTHTNGRNNRKNAQMVDALSGAQQMNRELYGILFIIIELCLRM